MYGRLPVFLSYLPAFLSKIGKNADLNPLPKKARPARLSERKKPDFKRLSAGTGVTETAPKRAPPSQLHKRLEIMMPPEGRGVESHRLRQKCFTVDFLTKKGRSMRARCRSIMWNTAMSRSLRRKSSTKFRRSLRGASRSVASTAERVFFSRALSVGTAVPTSARKSGTRPQNTAGSSGNATANSRVSTNAKCRIWTRKPLKRGS